MSQSKYTTSQRGAALIELCMVLPLFLAISFSGFELSRIIHCDTVMSTMAREAARVGMKKCGSDPDPLSYVPCIDVTRATMDVFAQQALPGATFIISMYEFDPLTITIKKIATSSSPGAPITSRYTEASLTDETIGKGIDKAPSMASFRSRIVISEVFYTDTTISPRFYLFIPEKKDRYETALF